MRLADLDRDGLLEALRVAERRDDIRLCRELAERLVDLDDYVAPFYAAKRLLRRSKCWGTVWQSQSAGGFLLNEYVCPECGWKWIPKGETATDRPRISASRPLRDGFFQSFGFGKPGANPCAHITTMYHDDGHIQRLHDVQNKVAHFAAHAAGIFAKLSPFAGKCPPGLAEEECEARDAHGPDPEELLKYYIGALWIANHRWWHWLRRELSVGERPLWHSDHELMGDFLAYGTLSVGDLRITSTGFIAGAEKGLPQLPAPPYSLDSAVKAV